jgi:hypothetical protein
MRLAAIALLQVATARAKASGQQQTNLDLLLAAAGDGVEQPVIALPACNSVAGSAAVAGTGTGLIGRDSARGAGICAAE